MIVYPIAEKQILDAQREGAALVGHRLQLHELRDHIGLPIIAQLFKCVLPEVARTYRRIGHVDDTRNEEEFCS